MPPLTRLVIVLTWAWVGYAAGTVFQWQWLGRLRALPLAFAAPGLLLLSRASTPVKDATGLSPSRVVIVWFLAVIVLAVPISFIPLVRARWALLHVFLVIAGAVALYVLAADYNVADWLPAKGDLASARDRRNVALIFIDTMRYDDATSLLMPRLEAFARGATSFDSAWASAPWTVPSHLSVLSGADPWTILFPDNGMPETPPTLAERFRARDYTTGAVFSNPLLSRGAGFHRGFDEFAKSRDSGVCRTGLGDLLSRLWFHGGPRTPICGWWMASEVTDRAVHFVRRADRPFFLAVNYLDPHEPYYVPPECRPPSFRQTTRAEREAVLTSTPHSPARPDVVERVHAQYRMAVQCMDRSVGVLLGELAKDPNTIIVVVGDHGEQFGEHGLGGHGNSIFEQLLHVPLIVKMPGIAAGRITTPISISDLNVGLAVASDPSRSASPLPLFDERRRRPVVANGVWWTETKDTDSAFSVTSGDYHFIRWRDGREALYDYRTDPQETTPLPVAQHREVADPMREIVVRAARRQKRVLEFNALGYMQ